MRGTRGEPRLSQAIRRIIPAHAGNSTCSHARATGSTDHPRACGELEVLAGGAVGESGSSPRMRGTLVRPSPSASCLRIIPAHAGNSGALRSEWRRWPDHPRACGELDPRRPAREPHGGSSPRMRGTRAVGPERGWPHRIIPAHAGNSWCATPTARFATDHPRACGELLHEVISLNMQYGSSPRMRGTPRRDREPSRSHRIIPAHAGNSSKLARTARHVADHPRACGELDFGLCELRFGAGSSPRMRGTRALSSRRPRTWRIIPAHAGNSWRWRYRLRPSPDHPRACGELPDTLRLWAGTHRIIPAHAGNSSPRKPLSRTPPDHPRACGELLPICGEQNYAGGSSPRMRGTRSSQFSFRGCNRIIPAHAGNSDASVYVFRQSADHPRACGELQLVPVESETYVGSSPRMRGTPSLGDHDR